MYCSTCGQQIAEHLNYCNNCGARLEKTGETPAVSARQSMRGLSIVLMVGFAAFIAVLKIVLGNDRLDMPATVMILLAYLAALTVIAAMYFGFMWKSAGLGRDRSLKRNASTDEYAAPRSFRGSNTSQLGEPTYHPVGSVTDSTTRTLDEVPIARNR